MVGRTKAKEQFDGSRNFKKILKISFFIGKSCKGYTIKTNLLVTTLTPSTIFVLVVVFRLEAFFPGSPDENRITDEKLLKFFYLTLNHFN